MFPLTSTWALAWPTQTIEAVAGVVYLILALSVTADVLLKKSDVRSALGWIAAAWLSPIFGSLLYYMFGINRVTRRALRLRRHDDSQARRGPNGAEPVASPDIALLAEVGRRITESPLVAGNGITVLEGGDQAYPAMLAAIAGAEKCIAMASYIYRDDAAGKMFTEALIAAKHRGVEVRVLLDSVGTGYVFSAALNRLRAGGVRADRFLHTWVPWRMPFLNMRNHRKFLIVDGTLAFTGGMNIDAGHSRRLAGHHAYIEDVHFQVEGPVVRSLMDAFAGDWTFTTDELLDRGSLVAAHRGRRARAGARLALRT